VLYCASTTINTLLKVREDGRLSTTYQAFAVVGGVALFLRDLQLAKVDLTGIDDKHSRLALRRRDVDDC
jgi:hypothetical protein